MPTACLNLFHHTCSLITPKHILDFCPSDPGYANYVRAFTDIFDARKLPKKCDFDISETIGLTMWCDLDAQNDTVRFRRFRVFTTAIGLSLAVHGIDRADELCPNYLAITLIDDAYNLGDPQLLSLLTPAVQEFIDVVPKDEPGETQFLLLALLILHFLANTNLDPNQLASRLITEDSKITHRQTDEFLWGNTLYDTLHPKWKRYVRSALLPTSPTLRFLKAALTADKPNV